MFESWRFWLAAVWAVREVLEGQGEAVKLRYGESRRGAARSGVAVGVWLVMVRQVLVFRVEAVEASLGRACSGPAC